MEITDVYVGGDGYHPSSWSFELINEDPDVRGLYPYIPGVDRGVFIGYNGSTQTWILSITTDKIVSHAVDNVSGIIVSNNTISELDTFGVDPLNFLDDQLLINTGNGLHNSFGYLLILYRHQVESSMGFYVSNL